MDILRLDIPVICLESVLILGYQLYILSTTFVFLEFYLYSMLEIVKSVKENKNA